MAKINLGKVVPEKGVDYFTTAEINQIKSEIESNLDTRLTTDENNIATNTSNINKLENEVNSLDFKEDYNELKKDLDNTTLSTTDTPSTFLALQDTAKARLKSCRIDGVTQQEIRSGKNLYNKATKTDNALFAWETGVATTETNSIVSDFIDKSNLTTLFSNYYFVPFYYDENKNYLGAGPNLSVEYSAPELNTTIPNNNSIAYIRVEWRTGANNSENMTTKTDIMLTSTEQELTPYEDYGVMPSPEFPSKIKNLEAINKFNKDLTPSYTQNTIITVLDTGIRATTTSTMSSRYGIIEIPNSDELLGKTVTISAILTPSINDDNMAKITLFGLKSDGTVEGSALAVLNTTGYKTAMVTIPNQYPTNVVKYGLLFYSNSTATVSEGDYVDYTNIQLEINSVATPYIPYNCIQVKKSNKNIASLETSVIKKIGGVDFNVENGIIYIDGTTSSGGGSNFYFDIFNVKSGTAMFWVEITGYTDVALGNAYIILQESSDGSIWSTAKEISLKSTTDHSYQVTLDSSKYYRIRFYVENNTFTNATIKVQLEYGELKTDFIPHEEQSYNLLLGDIKLMQGSYLADDGIHQVRKQIVLDGSADESWGVQLTNSTPNRLFFAIPLATLDKMDRRHCISNYFSEYIGLQSSEVDITGIQFNQNFVYSNILYIKIERSLLQTEDVAGFKTWLSTHNVIVEYDLGEEEIIPYNDDQYKFYREFKNLRAYEGLTYLTCYANLRPVMHAVGIKDIRTVLDNLDARITILEEE